MSLDSALWFTGILAQAAVLGLLVYRRTWRHFPVFVVFCGWDLLCDGGNYVVLQSFRSNYAAIYLIETIISSVLEFGVLIELTWSVLRPIRASLPRSSWIVVGILILAAGAFIWPFTGVQGTAHLAPHVQGIMRMQQTTSVLRILFFLLLAGCSQLLSIGWRDREMQVVTGLGFYSLVSLAVTIMRMNQTTVFQGSHLNQFLVASYVCSLLYWVFSFAQEEAERREFTPQMQNFLLAVAGSARATRLAMASSSGDDSRDGGKP